MSAEPRSVPPSPAVSAVAVVAASIPLILAALLDPLADVRALRMTALGVALGGDRGGGPPLAQMLVPIATVVPVADVVQRSAIALALPAAAATWLVTARAAGRPFGGGPWAASALVLGFGVVAAALLATIDPAVSLVVVAIEIALRARALPAGRRSGALGWAGAAALMAAWGAPRLAPPVAVALIGAAIGTPIRPVLRRIAVTAVPLVGAAVVLLVVRDAQSWLTLGRPLDDGVFVRGAGGISFASLVVARTAAVVAVLASVSISVLGWRRGIDPQDRLAIVAAFASFGSAWLLHPVDGAVTCVVTAVVPLLPIAAFTASAAHLAFDRSLRARDPVRGGSATPLTLARRVVTWIVPALALGLGARAVEDDLDRRTLRPDVDAARGVVPILTWGASAPRAVLVVEEARALCAWSHARVTAALRPDVHILPVQRLLLGGGGRMATRTMNEVPGAIDVVRGLLARGTLEEADASPLVQRNAVYVDLPASRLHAVARHMDPTGGALRVALERVDPSDRRLHRATLDRRLLFVVASLAGAGGDDPFRTMLRVAGVREARVVAAGGDREGAAWALARALALGADPERTFRWTARLHAPGRQTLDTEPLSEDD